MATGVAIGTIVPDTQLGGSTVITGAEGRQIRICRVLCIFFMMGVHVYPGAGQPSYVMTGPAAELGLVWVDFLGRISVAALSFISGYLLVATRTREETVGRYAGRRFRTVYVPMLVWNAVFVVILVADVWLRGTERPFVANMAEGDPTLWAARLLGVTGHTANFSLFFIRDLFVASLLALVLLPAIRIAPAIVILVAVLGTLADAFEPVVFRAPILLFVLLGAAAAAGGLRLEVLSRPRVALPAVLGCVVVLLLLPELGLGEVLTARADDCLRRVLLSFLILMATAAMVTGPLYRPLAAVERDIFLVYLMHLPFMGLLWAVWTEIGLTAIGSEYLIFFVGAHFAAIAAGLALGRLLDRGPVWLQTLLRGKVSRAARDARPRSAHP
ncbi:MAG: acyltransferase [Paracoccaceae bacterium]